jgi:hypothetical protein
VALIQIRPERSGAVDYGDRGYAHHLVPISLCPALARGASSETPMIRIWIIGSVLVLALNVPAAAQQRSVPEILERLHRLCDQDYL